MCIFSNSRWFPSWLRCLKVPYVHILCCRVEWSVRLFPSCVYYLSYWVASSALPTLFALSSLLPRSSICEAKCHTRLVWSIHTADWGTSPSVRPLWIKVPIGIVPMSFLPRCIIKTFGGIPVKLVTIWLRFLHCPHFFHVLWFGILVAPLWLADHLVVVGGLVWFRWSYKLSRLELSCSW